MLKKIFNRKIIIFPVLAFVFIAIIIIYHTLLTRYVRQSILESGELNAGRTSTEIELYISSGKDTLEECSYKIDRMIIENAPESEYLEYLTEETELLQHTTFIDTTGLYAFVDGTYYDGSGWDPGPDYYAAERPWYTEGVAGNGEIVLVNPYVDLYSGKIVMTIAKCLSDKESVVAVDITLEKIQEIIKNHTQEYNNTINMVISSNGMVVAHSDPSEIGNNYLDKEDTPSALSYNIARSAKDGSGFDFKCQGKSYSATVVQISNGWLAISLADYDTVYAPVNRMGFLSVLAILLTLLIFSLVTYFSGKKDFESSRLETLLKSSADIYMSLCEFDLSDNTVTEIKNVNPAISDAVKTVDHNANEVFKKVMSMLPDSPTKQMAIDFTDLSTIDERMKDTDTATIEYSSFGGNWVRARLIVSQRTREGKVSRVLWMLENITKEKEERDSLVDMSERAVAASEAKSAFLSNMSHEIRTPINAVLGMNEMILRESDDKNIISYANMIKSAGNSLLGIINDILDFSKIESGKMELVPVDYDIGVLLNDVVNLTKVRMLEKGLEMKMDIDPTIPRGLHGDEVRIKQIITNMLTNAAKYTEKGSVTLTVKLDSAGSDDSNAVILFAITDTGIGIRKEDMGKLFTEFERIDIKKNRKIEGTGLGLAISKNLLRLMGSHLHVESEYGKGSKFSFTLKQPVRNSEPIGEFKDISDSLAKKQNSYVPQFTAPNARILMVDDVMVNLIVFKGLLKKTGITIDTAGSGKEGIELTHINKYDVLFLDHLMPGMDGLETLSIIRSDDNNINKDTIAVCLTANAISGVKEFYLENGFDDYLAKPIYPDQLEKLLSKYIL